MDQVREDYSISLNRACKVLSVSKTAYYYELIKSSGDLEIKQELLKLAQQYPRWGFDKMMDKIRMENKPWNHKCVYRIYCENRLNIRIKPRKRIAKGEAKSLLQPISSNLCWSMDFMSDALSNGQKFRTFNVTDDYNRECLLIKPRYSLTSQIITGFLDEIAKVRGYPQMIRVDNGSEFRSGVFNQWALKHHILIHYIQPGKPAQNAYIERFNRIYREDILDMNLFDNLNEVAKLTKEWIQLYNLERPHESLDGLSPMNFSIKRKEKQFLNHSTFI